MPYTDEQKQFAIEHVREYIRNCDEEPTDIKLMVVAHVGLHEEQPGGWVDMSAEVFNEPENRKAISEVLTTVFQSN